MSICSHRTLDSGDRRLQTPPTMTPKRKFEKALIYSRTHFLEKQNTYTKAARGTKRTQKWTKSGPVQGPIFKQPKWSYEGDSLQTEAQKVVLDHIWTDMVQDHFLGLFLEEIPFIAPFWLLKNGFLNTTRSDHILDHFCTVAPNGICVSVGSKNGFLGR